MTPSKEDYLKLILKLGGDKVRVTNKQLSERIHLAPSTVSEMILRMEKEELLNNKRYHGVLLTEKGVKLAEKLIRYHRLWENFLVTFLDFDASEVHDRAELLEHVTDDELADRLKLFLDYPEKCPHGKKIL